jgi:hypothetical protein
MTLKLLPIIILLVSCSSYKQIKKPRLIVNGKTHHSWIENRRPPIYGDGLEAGCVVMGEFEVDLQFYGDGGSGIIKDVNNRKGVSQAQVIIGEIAGPHLVVTTNDSGSFRIATIRDIKTLSVMALGYRQIFIHPHFSAR